MNGIKILSIGSFLPKTKVTNEMFAEIMDTTDEWITTRTGIKTRNYADEESTHSMAVEAAKIAIDRAGISKQDISVVIVATCTPDYICPNVAGIVCSELNLAEEVIAFDLNAACSGFIYAINAAKNLLEACEGYALVVGSDTVTKMVDFSDRASCILFADGAGAAVLELAKDAPYQHVAGRVDNNGAILWKGMPNPSNPFVKRKDEERPNLFMDGKEVFRFAVDKVAYSIGKVLERAKITASDIDYYVCHQANLRILSSAAKNLGANEEKFFTNIEHNGNTSAASIPLALDDMLKQGLLKRGMKLILAGFGGGLTYGATYLEY